MGNQSPVGGSILARAWVRIPYLPPPSSFAFGARGSPSPITSRPGTRAIGAYRNQVRHVHPRLPGFIGYGKAIPGFGPATADASCDHVTTTGVAWPTSPLRCGKPRRCLARAQPDRGAGVTDGSGRGYGGPGADKSGLSTRRNDGHQNSLEGVSRAPGKTVMYDYLLSTPYLQAPGAKGP